MKYTPLKIVGWVAIVLFFVVLVLFSTGNKYPTTPQTVGENASPRTGLYNPANLIYVTKDKIDRQYKHQIRFYTTPEFGLIEEDGHQFVGFNPKKYLENHPSDVALVQYKGDDENRLLYVVDIFTDNPTDDIPGY